MNKQAKLKQDQDVAKDDLTIILSYPHVYRFKPICYGMIVAVLNCHSSVITIMDNNRVYFCIFPAFIEDIKNRVDDVIYVLFRHMLDF